MAGWVKRGTARVNQCLEQQNLAELPWLVLNHTLKHSYLKALEIMQKIRSSASQGKGQNKIAMTSGPALGEGTTCKFMQQEELALAAVSSAGADGLTHLLDNLITLVILPQSCLIGAVADFHQR